MLYTIFTILVETIIVTAVGSFVFYVSINLSQVGKRRTQTPKYSPMVKNSGGERPDFITKISDVLLAYKIRRKTRFSKKFDNDSSVLGDFFFALRDLYGLCFKGYSTWCEEMDCGPYLHDAGYNDFVHAIAYNPGRTYVR